MTPLAFLINILCTYIISQSERAGLCGPVYKCVRDGPDGDPEQTIRGVGGGGSGGARKSHAPQPGIASLLALCTHGWERVCASRAQQLLDVHTFLSLRYHLSTDLCGARVT